MDESPLEDADFGAGGDHRFNAPMSFKDDNASEGNRLFEVNSIHGTFSQFGQDSNFNKTQFHKD